MSFGMRLFAVGLSLALVLQGALAQARTHAGDPLTIPRVVARLLPTVVSIVTRQIERDQFNQAIPIRGLGSGVIIDRRGYIFTNHHVIDGAEDVRVTLTDGRSFRAVVVGSDPSTDLAVLKIDAPNLRAARLGDSSRLMMGQTVIAIGNPLWIEGGPTVTVGVVSGLGRSMEQEGLPFLHNLIQTDAAINPGNSGGPLVSTTGGVVGINTAVIPSAHGIGFAIAVNQAKPILQTLIAGGRIVRPALGVAAVSLTPQLASANGLPIERGALVIGVEPGGPAEAAGLEAGDVITQVGGEPVKDLHHFHNALWRRRPGDVVGITVWREGRLVDTRASLGVAP